MAAGRPGGGGGCTAAASVAPLVAAVYGPVYATRSRHKSRVDGDVSATNEPKAARKQSQTNLPHRGNDDDRESKTTRGEATRDSDRACHLWGWERGWGVLATIRRHASQRSRSEEAFHRRLSTWRTTGVKNELKKPQSPQTSQSQHPTATSRAAPSTAAARTATPDRHGRMGAPFLSQFQTIVSARRGGSGEGGALFVARRVQSTRRSGPGIDKGGGPRGAHGTGNLWPLRPRSIHRATLLRGDEPTKSVTLPLKLLLLLLGRCQAETVYIE